MKKIFVFILFVLLFCALCNVVIFCLEDYSILYIETGEITYQYVIYAIIGIVFDTPTPFWSYLITKKICDKTPLKESLKRVFHNRNILITVLTVCFTGALIYTFSIINGTRNESPFYLMFLTVPVLIIGGGIEEVGWRGLLQPELEKKLPYPIATLITSLIWWAWHLPLWFQPTSNHYSDSMIGFLIMVVTWSFLLSILYKITKCSFACVIVHAIVNSVGAIYDWNDLFDYFPTRPINIVCYSLVIIVSIIAWYLVDKKDKIRKENNENGLQKSRNIY